jgi:tryptophan-rich sensory protein
MYLYLSMFSTILYYSAMYLLIGTIATFMLDLLVRYTTTDKFSHKERVASIILWPYMIAATIYHAIRYLTK